MIRPVEYIHPEDEAALRNSVSKITLTGFIAVFVYSLDKHNYKF